MILRLRMNRSYNSITLFYFKFNQGAAFEFASGPYLAHDGHDGSY